ncbi:MAG: hypothetical protein RLZZ165_540 [Bacteroidota bacterium]
MDDKNRNPNQLNIEMPADVAGGVYSNFTIVGHTVAEFVLDFVQIIPGTPQAKLRSRVIMTPHHVKRLLQTLEENIDRYEASFGDIPTMDGPQSPPTPPGYPAGPAGYA